MFVLNAAVNPSATDLLKTKESVLDKLWEINVKSSILLMQVTILFSYDYPSGNDNLLNILNYYEKS